MLVLTHRVLLFNDKFVYKTNKPINTQKNRKKYTAFPAVEFTLTECNK